MAGSDRVKPPKTVTVGCYEYRVKVTKGARKELRGTDNYGDCDHMTQRIRVDSDLAPDMAAESLFHEVLHACNNATGLNTDFSDEQEESIVRRTAPMLLDTLRRNPALVEYLLS